MKIYLFLYVLIVKGANQSKFNEIVPKHYDLRFVIKPEGFEGMTRIKFGVKENTKIIEINSQDLDIESVILKDESNEYRSQIYNISTDTIKLIFETEISSDKEFILEIKYTGKYSTQMDGIYTSSSYGKTIYSTHFEATSARKAFPCFDQPGLKSTFTLKITVEDENVVLSNSSLSEKIGNTFIFNKTKKMSTYLVAFVVGKFDYVQISSSRNIPIRVYTDKSEIDNATFALKVAKEALDFFDNYFDIPYPFPKLDLIAIPSFAMGAMENWGLVTFRKSMLLYNKKYNDTSSKLSVLQTVCHELAHMWFGNLVTMKWWNDLWLNEGFATWASAMAIYNLPKKLVDFDIWLNFISEDLDYSLEYDAFHSTHPIAVDVKNPDEINQIFDHISYNKGASIIRMIEHHVGHESFRSGIQKYMRKYEYSNALSKDMFACQKNPNAIVKMVNSWIKQEGFPLIKIEEKGDKLKIKQTRFFTGFKKIDNQNWIIPLSVQFKDKPLKKLVLDKKELIIPKEDDIYKFNIQSTGVFRVQYNSQAFEKIIKYYSDAKERLNIINDLFALSFGHYVDIKMTIKLILDNVSFDEYEILKSVLSQLKKLYGMYYDDDKSKKYILEIIKKILEKDLVNFNIKNEGSSLTDKLRNSLILKYAVFIKDETIIHQLHELYDEFKQNGTISCPDYTFSIFTAVVEDKFDEIIHLAKTSKVLNIKIMAIKALGRVRKYENIRKLLNSYNFFDRQDLIYLFSGVSSNYIHKDKIVLFFINNYSKISEYINNDSILNASMSHVLCGVTDSVLAQCIKRFLNSISQSGSSRTIKKILEYNFNVLEFKQKNPKLNLEI